MTDPSPSNLHALLSGRAQGRRADAVRAILRCAQPLYAAAVSLRNRLYDSRLLRSHRLAVPVVSVGNITTGGTGKTPLVRWLAQRLDAAGLHPAILMRGYRRSAAGQSDEQTLLAEYLASRNIPVHADPDRVAGGRRIIADHPDTAVILLDDGFQHRRLARDFDLVLIDASNPFGYGHILPRGLLREPLPGLCRADAFVLTRSDQIDDTPRQRIEETLRIHNHIAPIYRARHALTGLRSPSTPAGHAPDLPIDALSTRRFFAFAGIANPAGLDQQLVQLPGAYRGHHWFPDHHDYTAADLAGMRSRAQRADADVLLVTEKDWSKLRLLPEAAAGTPPIWRLELELHLEEPAATGLIALIQARLESSRMQA